MGWPWRGGGLQAGTLLPAAGRATHEGCAVTSTACWPAAQDWLEVAVRLPPHLLRQLGAANFRARSPRCAPTACPMTIHRTRGCSRSGLDLERELGAADFRDGSRSCAPAVYPITLHRARRQSARPCVPAERFHRWLLGATPQR